MQYGCRVCVWFVAGLSSLTWPQSGWLVWGWVRLHTWSALSLQGPQVEPAMSTHTKDGEWTCQATTTCSAYRTLQTPTNNFLCPGCGRSPAEATLVACSKKHCRKMYCNTFRSMLFPLLLLLCLFLLFEGGTIWTLSKLCISSLT